MRINAYLARHTKLARRKADKAIEEGRVFVNGLPADIGQEVATEDSVTLDDELVSPQTLQYVVLNKPKGYVSSRKKTSQSPIIYELLPPEHYQLKPAGRLDKNSEGILLLTNDGKVIQRLTHPRNEKQKEYFITLDAPLSDTDKSAIENGVELKDGISAFDIEPQEGGYIITLTEGRNRQIRRTFGALGYRIEKLERVKFGPYELNSLNLAPGEWKEVSPPPSTK